MKKPMILSCGEVLWDLFPDGPRLGGAPANFACHAALLGGDVSFLTAVGDDARGGGAVDILRGFGVDTSLIQRIAHTTTGAVDVRFDAANRPHYRIHPESSWDHIAWTSAFAARIAEADAIYFGTLGQRSATSRETTRRALHAAKSRAIPRVLDINLRAPFYDAPMLRDSIALATVVKLSDEELAEVASACEIPLADGEEPALRGLLSMFGLDLVVMTRGADGALAVVKNRVVEQAGIPTEVVDTVGAGDSFTAGLTLGLLRFEPLEKVIHRACEIASNVCAHAGATPRA